MARLRTPLHIALAALVSALCTGCGATADQLRTRAAYDMKCDEGKIQLVEIDGRTYGVSGCGRRATYVESCDRVQGWSKTGCTWVKNDESGGDDEDAPRSKKKHKKARSTDDEE